MLLGTLCIPNVAMHKPINEPHLSYKRWSRCYESPTVQDAMQAQYNILTSAACSSVVHA